jgi:hypothetical protein
MTTACPVPTYFNSSFGEVYMMQQYVIKFVSDLRQVSGFLRFAPPIKLASI